MGRNIRAQRLGRGSPSFAASLRRKFQLGFPTNLVEAGKTLVGIVRRLHHDPGRGAPVAEVELQNGVSFAIAAVEGMSEGQKVYIGSDAPIQVGNIVPLGKLPEGAVVSSVELRPGDGGKLARSSGAYATVMAQMGEKTLLRLPSKKIVELSSKALAVIGTVAGGGRVDKPFMKAGKRFHWMKAKRRPYPRVRGVAMAPAFHPFGGGSHKRIGRPETVSRNAPPGRKVGLIAARRTGRKKKG
ncbi:MAG: 50S ribosomal protein L2 [Candidatus Terraquivivens tikiterensis]|uniref:Large ribosomal subunit protein uL2 n=1 Tax=Candidatus Terraquivivens tikiterensis TaxID=1980982 RepID=A0A2R7Y2F5_9ARCH|nr:MAG: 50S ribosomal protein L2 [Candidatus Terraquivivens tikiterensis]